MFSKKLIKALSFATLFLIISGCASSGSSGSEDGEKLTMSIAYSGEIYESVLNDFAEKTEELSDGDIEIDTIAPGTMGSEKELAESIQDGSIDIASLSDNIIETTTNEMRWAFLPYIVTDYDEVDEHYLDGWVREEIYNVMENNEMVPLASYDNGFRNFGSSEKSVKSMDDFKGIKVRVPDQKDLLRLFELTGAIAVGMDGTEVASSLEQGTIDAADNTIYNFDANGYLDNINFITELNYQYAGNNIAISPSVWENLSEEEQEILQEAAEYAGQNYTDTKREGEQELIEEYDGNEVEFIEPDQDFQDEMKEIASEVWDESEEEISDEIMEKLREDFGDNLK